MTSSGLQISSDSTYNPYGHSISGFRRRLSEFGSRVTHQGVNVFRLVLGVDGTTNSWKWGLSAGYGRTEAQQIDRGHLVKSRLAAAMGPSYRDDQGVAHCGTIDVPGDPRCVPLDVLGGYASITPAMASFLSFTAGSPGFNEQQTVLIGAHGPRHSPCRCSRASLLPLLLLGSTPCPASTESPSAPPRPAGAHGRARCPSPSRAPHASRAPDVAVSAARRARGCLGLEIGVVAGSATT